MGAFRTLTCKFVLYWRNNNGRNNLNLCFHNEISGNNISVLCLCSEEVFNISINYPLNYWNIGGDLAPRLGGREKIISQTKISELRFFRKNFHFTPKISDDLYFFSHRPCFPDFFYLFPDFPYLYWVKCLIWPILHEKKSYLTPFLLCSYFRLLKILGGRMHGPSPPQVFWGDRPRVPLDLRPWLLESIEPLLNWCTWPHFLPNLLL